MKNISTKWKNIIVWVASYVSSLAFILVGAYLWKNETEEETRKTVKKVFIVHLIVLAVNAIILFFDRFLFGICDINYGSGFYGFWDIFKALISIATIVTYAVFVLIELCKSNKQVKVEKTEKPEKEETK